MKRKLWILVCFALILSLFPFNTKIQAEDLNNGTFSYKINEDGTSVTITKYLGRQSMVKIPSTIDGKSVTVIGAECFYQRNITGVTFPSTLKKIERAAFFQCAKMTNFALPRNLEVIEKDAFARCVELTTINIPAKLTEIPESCFSGCSKLDGIKIPNKITKIGAYAFENCQKLSEIEFPSSVKEIGDRAFYGCEVLTSVEIPKEITTLGQGIFTHCKKLEAVNVDAANPNYCSVDGALYTKDKKTLMSTPGTLLIFNIIDEVEIIDDYAFYGNEQIQKITIPGHVKRIGDFAFYECTHLNTAILEEGIEYIGEKAFSSCYYTLVSINVPASVTHIGVGAFEGCNLLEAINVDENNQNYCSVDGVVYSKDKKTLIQVPAAFDTVVLLDSLTAIEECALMNCYRLQSVNIPSSVERIGAYAFYYCANLKEIVIPNKVTVIEPYTFYCNSRVIKLKLSDNITTISDHAFENCYLLPKLQLPRSVTSIGYQSFYGCVKLNELHIPKEVTSINEGAFPYCPVLNIYGENNSTIQTYAQEHNIPFINGYQEEYIEIDYTELNTWIAKAEKVVEKDYTADSYRNMKNALDKANAILGIAQTQSQVDEACDQLKAAYEALAKPTPVPPVEKMSYVDVKEGDWFYFVVERASQLGLMKELENKDNKSYFGPNENITRGMVATILYRMAGSPDITFSAKFPDVKAGIWYSDAIIWANQVGVVKGYTDGTFGPDKPITRQDFAVMIRNYADKVGKLNTSSSVDLNKFVDVKNIDVYAKPSLAWAVENKIMSGKENGTKIAAKDNATRAECAKMFTMLYDLTVKK